MSGYWSWTVSNVEYPVIEHPRVSSTPKSRVSCSSDSDED